MDLRPYLQFNRRLSARVTRTLARTPLTPNAISAIGIACGALGCFAMAHGTRAWMLFGAFWFHAAFIIDNCDGEIARLKGLSSALGRKIDMVSDVLVDICLWTGFYFGAAAAGWAVPVPWLYAAFAGSLLNFGMSVWERASGCSSSIHVDSPVRAERKNSLLHSLFDTLAHNGDSAALIWLAGFLAMPHLCLAGGTIYIHGLWIFRLLANLPKLDFEKIPKPVLTIFKIAAFLLGCWILVYTFRSVSWERVGGLFREAGWKLPLVFLVFPFITFLHTLALRALFDAETRKNMKLLDLFGIKLAGESFNKITPFVDVGGEPAKAILLKKRGLAEPEESVAALGAFRITFIVSEIFCLAGGLAAATWIRPSWELSVWTGVAIVLSVISIFLVKISFKGLVKMGACLAGGVEDPDALAGRIRARLDRLVDWKSPAFWVSVFWSFLAWTLLSLEVYLAFWAFGVPMGAAEAFAIQSLLQAVTTLTFFVPGSIGTQEGGLAILLRHVYYTASDGVALSLLKRTRQVVWAALSIPLYYALKRGAPGAR